MKKNFLPYFKLNIWSFCLITIIYTLPANWIISFFSVVLICLLLFLFFYLITMYVVKVKKVICYSFLFVLCAIFQALSIKYEMFVIFNEVLLIYLWWIFIFYAYGIYEKEAELKLKSPIQYKFSIIYLCKIFIRAVKTRFIVLKEIFFALPIKEAIIVGWIFLLSYISLRALRAIFLYELMMLLNIKTFVAQLISIICFLITDIQKLTLFSDINFIKFINNSISNLNKLINISINKLIYLLNISFYTLIKWILKFLLICIKNINNFMDVNKNLTNNFINFYKNNDNNYFYYFYAIGTVETEKEQSLLETVNSPLQMIKRSGGIADKFYYLGKNLVNVISSVDPHILDKNNKVIGVSEIKEGKEIAASGAKLRDERTGHPNYLLGKIGQVLNYSYAGEAVDTETGFQPFEYLKTPYIEKLLSLPDVADQTRYLTENRFEIMQELQYFKSKTLPPEYKDRDCKKEIEKYVYIVKTFKTRIDNDISPYIAVSFNHTQPLNFDKVVYELPTVVGVEYLYPNNEVIIAPTNYKYNEADMLIKRNFSMDENKDLICQWKATTSTYCLEETKDELVARYTKYPPITDIGVIYSKGGMVVYDLPAEKLYQQELKKNRYRQGEIEKPKRIYISEAEIKENLEKKLLIAAKILKTLKKKNQ